MYDNSSIQNLLASHQSGWSLDQRFYTDPNVYACELERILLRNWFMAGHVSQIPRSGDFIVSRMDQESAIIVRTSDGSIKAFANVCRHRGSLICLENQGSVRSLRCPYHGWTYDLDGDLIASRSMPAEWDKSEYSLKSVSIEIMGGLIFICFCDDPPSFSAAKRDLSEPMTIFGFDNMKIAAKKTYPMAANWKLAVENYQECYHCASAHPDYAKMHTLMLDTNKRDRLQKKMLSRFGACGLKDIELDFIDTHAPAGEQGYGYSRTALFEGYKTGSRNGEPLAPLLGQLTGWDGGASDWSFGPFTYILSYSDHQVAYVFTPVDAMNCQCEVYWMVRSDAEEGRDYIIDDLIWLWDVTTQADEKIIVNNWAGVKSRYYSPGPFSGMEDMESRYIDWIVRELVSTSSETEYQ